MSQQDNTPDSIGSILDEWLVHDLDCQRSLYNGKCTCIQARVKENLKQALEARETAIRISEVHLMFGNVPDDYPLKRLASLEKLESKQKGK